MGKIDVLFYATIQRHLAALTYNTRVSQHQGEWARAGLDDLFSSGGVLSFQVDAIS